MRLAPHSIPFANNIFIVPLLLFVLYDIVSLQTEPNFDLDIKEDVQEECSKFGNLRHIYVDK